MESVSKFVPSMHLMRGRIHFSNTPPFYNFFQKTVLQCASYTHISATKHSYPCRGKFEINAYGKKKGQPLRRKKLEG